jgi:hypothetical protein
VAGSPATRLDIESITHDLGVAGVRYVLTGSVAAAAYGVPVEPRDLDIAPDLDPENLSRLADVLRRWGAKPTPDPLWPESLPPEECEHWAPDPPTAEHLDHLLTTPHGLFDVVPTRSIAYADLIGRALPLVFGGRTILVAHPADLIAALRMHKTKHQVRLPQLRAVLERLSRGETIGPWMPSR